ncbi:MAG: thymidine phosphorylase [Clostridia bacterium]|nr:thymidine phosphorylase [Clostridia bacterium]
MSAIEIIKKKRDGLPLEFDEIDRFISGYLSGEIAEYQTSALLMAIYLNGMTDRELFDLTRVMAKSGDNLDLSEFGALSVDKHSTGGVGDKTTLVVSPIAAAAGCTVAKMSGRGLGFTGGTYDKLSSIPNYRITPDNSEFLKIARKVGVSVVGQSETLAPADKRIYALRDVTGTVESLPLIASSIMSKKIAAGAKNIVLDVKYGTGAFMKTPEDAALLANTMIKIGKEFGRNTAAVISGMNTPLGFAVGNNLEVIEAVEFLCGKDIPDLYAECITLSSLMVSLARGISVSEAEKICIDTLISGAAYEKFTEWISKQGGDISYIENTNRFKKSRYSLDVVSTEDGFITTMNTEAIGEISCILGAGREKVDDTVDYSAGIIINKKTGDRVSKGERLCRLYTDKNQALTNAAALYYKAVTVGKTKPDVPPAIHSIIL